MQSELSQAMSGYDEAFKTRLMQATIETVFRESIIEEEGVRACIIRTGETVDAMVWVIAAALAMSPTMDVPSRLREEIDDIGRKLRTRVAKARAEGTFNAFGAAKGGTA